MNGSVLLVCLWAMGGLAALQITQATQVSLELKRADRFQQRSQAGDLAWTAIEAAFAQMKTDSIAAWDAPKEEWAAVPEEPVPFPPGAFLYTVADEQSRIPLNAASQDLLLNLPGFTLQSAAELISRRATGKPVSHLGELTALSGFQPDQLSALEPLVTVHGAGPVNLNTASSGVLIRLGLSPGLADAIERFRRGPDGKWGTADDPVFEDLEQIPAMAEQAFGPLLPEDQLRLSEGISGGLLGVGSAFYRVEAQGRTDRHGITRKVTAVLERTDGAAPAIRAWYERGLEG